MVRPHRIDEADVAGRAGSARAVRRAAVDRCLHEQPGYLGHAARTAVPLDRVERGIAAQVDALRAFQDQLLHQRLLGAEVIVDRRAIAHAGRRDDVADRDAVDAALGEQALRGGLQSLARGVSGGRGLGRGRQGASFGAMIA
ncbi:hypothetical protein GCM10023089_25050 [Quisquiliibacterium transsilvanicum]